MEKANPEIMLVPHAQALDPAWALEYATAPTGPALEPIAAVWVNHHDALHSRWTKEHVHTLQLHGIKVLVTYHDTRERLVPGSKLAQLAFVADHIIVHEPVEGLTDMGLASKVTASKVTYLRQGVPELTGVYQLNWRELGGWPRPVLGTCGFDFPWKNYTRLAELTAEIGWGFLLCCPNLTEARRKELQAVNKYVQHVEPLQYGGMISAGQIVSWLAACTATAFMYECANTGTSGAIRLGIAARKPVYALKHCRQFRDLQEAEETQARGSTLINWVDGWANLRALMLASWPVDCDPAIVYLAERDSLTKVGARYAQILRSL